MNADTKAKIVEALRGSQIGAIVACALGVIEPSPCFASKAVITSDGFVQANFIGSDGRTHLSAFVGSYDDLKENLRSVIHFLQEKLDITADQSHELFNAVAFDWIATDYRS